MSTKLAWNWQSARLHEGRLIFDSPDGIKQAFKDGFFYVEQPLDLTLDTADQFARSWYLPEDSEAPDRFRGFSRLTGDKLDPPAAWLGYTDHKADQSEQFLLERAWWEGVYPHEMTVQAGALCDFTLGILRAVLPNLDLPPELWDKATGGCSSSRGYYALLFNHYRPQIRARGLAIHQDTGWLSVVRSTEPGLEVDRNGEWYPIDPVPGKFIVNFGVLMEILTRKTSTPVVARPHRVVEQPETESGKSDRASYVFFTDNSFDERVCSGIYEYEPGAGLIYVKPVIEFYSEYLHNTFDPEGSGHY